MASTGEGGGAGAACQGRGAGDGELTGAAEGGAHGQWQVLL